MNPLQIDVVGTPAPQGSKKGFVVNGRAVIVDDNKKPLKTWRQDVKAAALDAAYNALWGSLDGPVVALVRFYMPRPRSHYGTGRNAQALKPSAPAYPAVKPDIDKLARATLDALGEAGIWTDDSRVVVLATSKHYADLRLPGAEIQISSALHPTNSVAAALPSPHAAAATDPTDPQGVLL